MTDNKPIPVAGAIKMGAMSQITWGLIGALIAQGWYGTTVKSSNLTLGLGATPDSCAFRAGETVPTCGKDMRWTEIIGVTKQGDGDLVCGIIEKKVGDNWIVSEARMYCVRGRAKR